MEKTLNAAAKLHAWFDLWPTANEELVSKYYGAVTKSARFVRTRAFTPKQKNAGHRSNTSAVIGLFVIMCW